MEVHRLVTEINQTKCKKDGWLVLKETLDPYPNKGNKGKQNILFSSVQKYSLKEFIIKPSRLYSVP